MTYTPEDPLKKAELMADEMRRSRKRDLIASKRALRNPHTTEEKPVCPTCGGKREDPVSYLCKTEQSYRTHAACNKLSPTQSCSKCCLARSA